MKTRLLLSIFLLFLLCRPAHAITVTDLRCEYQVLPLAIDMQHPRLSWNLHSTKRGERSPYDHVLVSSSPNLLERNKGDLWDATVSFLTFPAAYAGKPLHSGQVCYWKVRAMFTEGAAGPWSEPSRWEMGPLFEQDWKASWINDGKRNPTNEIGFYHDDPAPLFRKTFNIAGRVMRARLAITGLGYYSARINGEPVGNQELGPAWTRFSKRVYYTVFDVTHLLHSGSNCLGVTLGNGWWNPLPLRMFGSYNLREYLPVGRPRFVAQLVIDHEDGSHQTVVSDTSWRVTDGPLRFNNIYLGERYDARNEIKGWDKPGIDDSNWRSPGLASEPVGRLQSQSQPPIRITKTIATANLTEPTPGVYIFDMGQNFAGWVRMTVKAATGSRIVLRYGELLNQDGTLNPMTSVAGQIKGSRRLSDNSTQSVGGPGAPAIAWQSDAYITAGTGIETYTPEFTFHGFRYVEVTGLLERPTRDTLVGLRLNTDVERVGTFTCSNPLLNRVQHMCDNSFLSNIFSVQSDCPHRERFGYGGDIVATSEAFMMNYDMDRFYAKVVGDYQDSALPNGMFTDTAPFVGIQYCGFAWAMAPEVLATQLARYYGDTRVYHDSFDDIKRWISLVVAQNPDGIIKSGLSDHETVASASPQVLLTPLYFQAAGSLGDIAGELAQSEPPGSKKRAEFMVDGRRYRDLDRQIQTTFPARFIDVTSGKVGDGTQASQAIALAMQIVPPSLQSLVLHRLVEQIEGPDKSHLTTGIFGTKYLLDVLSREGRGDLAYNIATQTSFPGWGYMLDHGATTLWEHWAGSDNTYSQNHPMFGSVSQWLFQWVGGIEPVDMNGLFANVQIHPLFLPELSETNCSYRSIRGKIVCNWRRENNVIHLSVEVPVGVRAGITMPTSRQDRITEDGKPLKEGNGIEAVSSVYEGMSAISATVGSGTYHFIITGK